MIWNIIRLTVAGMFAAVAVIAVGIWLIPFPSPDNQAEKEESSLEETEENFADGKEKRTDRDQVSPDQAASKPN